MTSLHQVFSARCAAAMHWVRGLDSGRLGSQCCKTRVFIDEGGLDRFAEGMPLVGARRFRA